jgi:uncharacterized protein (TIGR02246 family)
MKPIFQLLVVLWCASSCADASAALANSLSAEWASDWSAKKLDAVMTLYAPEPVFLPTVGLRWVGLGMIRKNFGQLLAEYNPHIALHSINADSSNNLAYDSGTYEETITPVKNGRAITTKGAYLFVFQRQKDGDWKILEQTWTDFEQPPRL